MEEKERYTFFILNHTLAWILIGMLVVGILWVLITRKRPGEGATNYEEQLSKYWQRTSWLFLVPAYVAVALSAFFLLTDANIWFISPIGVTVIIWIASIPFMKMFIKTHFPFEIGPYMFWNTPLASVREGVWVEIPGWIYIPMITTTLFQKERPTDYPGQQPIMFSTGEMADFSLDLEKGKATFTITKADQASNKQAESPTDIATTEQGVLRTVIKLVCSVRISFQFSRGKTKKLFEKFGREFMDAEKKKKGSGEAAMVEMIYSQLFDEAASKAEGYGPKHSAREILTNQDALNEVMKSAVVARASDYVDVEDVSIVSMDYDPAINKTLDEYTDKILKIHEGFYEETKKIEIYEKKTAALNDRTTKLNVTGTQVLEQETTTTVAEKVGNLYVVTDNMNSLSGMLQSSIAKTLSKEQKEKEDLGNGK